MSLSAEWVQAPAWVQVPPEEKDPTLCLQVDGICIQEPVQFTVHTYKYSSVHHLNVFPSHVDCGGGSRPPKSVTISLVLEVFRSWQFLSLHALKAIVRSLSSSSSVSLTHSAIFVARVVFKSIVYTLDRNGARTVPSAAHYWPSDRYSAWRTALWSHCQVIHNPEREAGILHKTLSLSLRMRGLDGVKFTWEIKERNSH